MGGGWGVGGGGCPYHVSGTNFRKIQVSYGH